MARTTATNRVIRWQRAEAVDRRQLLAGQSTGIWLTRAGLALLDLPNSVWTPTPAGLTHLLAINQVRLWLEREWPDARWCSERQLRSELPLTRRVTLLEHRPDAEVQFGVQTVAIEVEWSAKTPQRVPAMLFELAGRYESSWYCCSQATEASMRRALAQLEAAVQRKFSGVSLP